MSSRFSLQLVFFGIFIFITILYSNAMPLESIDATYTNNVSIDNDYDNQSIHSATTCRHNAQTGYKPVYRLNWQAKRGCSTSNLQTKTVPESVRQLLDATSVNDELIKLLLKDAKNNLHLFIVIYADLTQQCVCIQLNIEFVNNKCKRLYL